MHAMTFGTLAVLVAAGLAGPLLAAARPGVVPVVVGEIAAGVALGAAGLGWIDPDEPVVDFLATMGFALLMFVAGTHVPLRDPGLRGALRAGTVAATITAALATGTAIALAAWLGIEAGVLVLVLATSSAAIALPLLRERRVTSEAALIALAWVTIADVATIMALPVLLHGDGAARVAAGSLGVSALALVLWLAARATRGRSVIGRLRAQSNASSGLSTCASRCSPSPASRMPPNAPERRSSSPASPPG
jgi:Kef-type K+ transport system membrane component KefB